MSRRGQHIVFGSIFLLFIFFLVITIFFDDLFYGKELQSATHDVLLREAARATDSLAREGYPVDWDQTAVRRVGLTTDGVFDQYKFSNLQGLFTSVGYEQLKPLLGVQHDYFLMIDLPGGDPSAAEAVYGDGFADEQELIDAEPTHLATQTRHLHDKEGNPVTITLHLYIP
ncbi:hypothetical protein JXA12_00485 [Candidatus Woesearchaeota archaeon]|nr:hypothetical protein [Candidatus Woesearchaeota archaeon]